MTNACGDYLATEALSIGDYVLSGGELPALVMLDAVARLVPGVVGDEESVARDPFMRGAAGFSAVHAAGDVSGAPTCRRCCCPGTMRRLQSGAGARRWPGPRRGGRICWSRSALDEDDQALLDEIRKGEK